MSDAVKISLISGAFSLLGLIATGIIAIMLKGVATKVDGHLSEALSLMTDAVKEKEHALGELQGRDYTREHMENRADAQAAKDVK